MAETVRETGLRLICALAGVCSECGGRMTFGESGSGIISGTSSRSSNGVGSAIGDTGDTGETGDHSVSS